MAGNADIAVSPESQSGASVGALGSRGAREFIRYLAASLLALAADAGVLALLTSGIGLSYLLAAPVGFCLGVTVIYLLSIAWVFERRDMKSRTAEFGVFLLVGVVGLGINELVLWALTGYFGLFYLVSKAASVCVVFSWNYLARKALLFS